MIQHIRYKDYQQQHPKNTQDQMIHGIKNNNQIIFILNKDNHLRIYYLEDFKVRIAKKKEVENIF